MGQIDLRAPELELMNQSFRASDRVRSFSPNRQAAPPASGGRNRSDSGSRDLLLLAGSLASADLVSDSIAGLGPRRAFKALEGAFALAGHATVHRGENFANSPA
jgi:hypothetical protein